MYKYTSSIQCKKITQPFKIECSGEMTVEPRESTDGYEVRPNERRDTVSYYPYKKETELKHTQAVIYRHGETHASRKKRKKKKKEFRQKTIYNPWYLT